MIPAMAQAYSPFQPTLSRTSLQKHGLAVSRASSSRVLRRYVFEYLQIHASRPTPYPVIPDGSQAIYISSQCIQLSGAWNKIMRVPILQPGMYFGIHFYPATLAHFLQADFSEIKNSLVPVDDYAPGFLPNLAERLYQQTSFAGRCRVCDQLLLQHFQEKPLPALDAALALLSRRPDLSVKQLASALGYSSRHVNRLITRATGLSSKSFTRVIRINQVCRAWSNNPAASALEMAYQFGFFDQSHFHKEFKQMLGIASQVRFLQDV